MPEHATESRPSDRQEPGPQPPAFGPAQAVYVWLTAAFVTCLLLANIVGSKFFSFGTVNLLGVELHVEHSVGMFAFPVTFLLTDLLNEYFGPRGARRVTYIGLAMSLFAFGFLWLATNAPPAPPERTFIDETKFDAVLGGSATMIFASMIAYMIGQFVDIASFQAAKRLTGNRLLWLRATGSTIISQAVDSACIMTVLYFSSTLASGKPPDLAFTLEAAAKGYAIKFCIALLTTPFMYLGRAIIQSVFGLTPLPATRRIW